MASLFMRIPTELRLMIYTYLFDAGHTNACVGYHPDPDVKTKPKPANHRIISIRNGHRAQQEYLWCNKCKREEPPRAVTRSRYQVAGGCFARRYFETTYFLENRGAYFCTALMRVNSKVYAETSPLVYADHMFDFGADVEAVKPFFSDLTPWTRALVKRVSLYKKGPVTFHGWSERSEWRAMCIYLCEYASVEHLRLAVQAGRVPEPREWEQWGPREFSRQDVALLVGIRHAMLEWVEDMFLIRTLRDVEVLPNFCVMPAPKTSDMNVYMALSASVDKGLKEFLKERLESGCCAPSSKA